MPDEVRFTLNGRPLTLDVEPDRRLVDLLREDLQLTAAKAACRIGRCGSCLVLLDGQPANACLLMAWQIDGASVVSPEGLDAFAEAALLREALAAEVSFQCGYCAPGFTMALTALLIRDAEPDEAAIRTALEGNLCRCTGYLSILRGAKAAVRALGKRRAAMAQGG